MGSLVAVLVIVSVPAVVRAAPPALVGGRIVFRNGSREARAEEIERRRWGHLSIELRRDWEVFPARPDGNGVFAFTGPPGTYRLEYVRIGELAEFFVPHEVEVREGTVTCVGTLEISVKDLGQDLGNNTSTGLRVRDDCAELGPELRKRGGVDGEVTTSLARPSSREGHPASLMDALVGLRVEADLASGPDLEALRGGFVYPLGEDDGEGNFIVAGSVMRVSESFIDARWPAAMGAPAAKNAWGGALGVGYSLWMLEAQAFGGYLGDGGRGAHGPLGGASIRFGSFLLGLGARMEWYPSTGDRIGTITLDLSPIALLGALL